MSNKHDLRLSDFEDGRLWSYDAEADDCSFAPFIPKYFDSGELDVEGSLFCKNLVQFANATNREAILGLNQYERFSSGKVTWHWRVNSIELFIGRRSLVLNIQLQIAHGTLVTDLSQFMGHDAAELFPMKIEVSLPSIECECEQLIEPRSAHQTR